ncbi:carbon-nitrogen hydrolase family protein [Ferroplasma acidiphilum]|jgi:predicted amidohydrolase|uniref:carbon-nitrogen hydrolase family protein n=1 Tax=Ferroplasma acidiphilum TaxID=74969 RepID=UPI0023F34936|nr:carbon-nitrogen hydrolase family protein [Ferroplasma acidiphilum]MCL4349773.1 carbon-nitrogen hydrolase family protein [Candidatus Thermoplasmatota archaeon]
MKIAIRALQSRRMPLESAMEYISSLNFPENEIIVFPEKFITTKVDMNSLGSLLKSIKIKNTIILGSLSYVDRFVYNRSFLIRNREIIGWQDKINLYKAESTKYTSGNQLKLFNIEGLKIGILVCYDLDFPDYARILFRKHCDVIFNPSLIRRDFHSEWHLYVKTRALENRIPIISVNSISDDFQGDSIVVAPEEGVGGVRINAVTSKCDDIVYQFDTSDYSKAREQRLREENLNIQNVNFLEAPE